VSVSPPLAFLEENSPFVNVVRKVFSLSWVAAPVRITFSLTSSSSAANAGKLSLLNLFFFFEPKKGFAGSYTSLLLEMLLQ